MRRAWIVRTVDSDGAGHDAGHIGKVAVISAGWVASQPHPAIGVGSVDEGGEIAGDQRLEFDTEASKSRVFAGVQRDDLSDVAGA